MKFNWGTGILIFILLFVALSVVFIVFALRQRTDLVEDNYYEQGAGYTKQMEINKRSEIFKDSIQLKMFDNSVMVNCGNSIQNMTDSIEVYFFRPSDRQEDFRIKLKCAQSMEVSKTNLTTGRYIVKFSWTGKKEEYLIQKEFFVK